MILLAWNLQLTGLSGDCAQHFDQMIVAADVMACLGEERGAIAAHCLAIRSKPSTCTSICVSPKWEPGYGRCVLLARLAESMRQVSNAA